ncbi:MAG TPA: PEGA domain-containing protein [Polyangiaceae bacterium]|nr:PEGA domain-containing protein [Polyangiaceae bacterium]
MSSFIAAGSVPSVVWAAPPAKAAPAKAAPAKKPAAKPAKGDDKGEDPKRAEARKAYGEAEAKFQSGDYEGAYAAYKAANDAVPAPQTLYKMAIALDKLDRGSEAIAAYGAFLSSNPPASMDSKVTEAKGRVDDLKKKAPIIVKVKSDPAGASVSVDGVAQTGATPLDVKTTAGKHKFKLTSAGYEAYEKELSLEPGQADAAIDATLPKSIPIAEAPPPVAPPKPVEKAPEPPPERRSNTAAYVVLGVAGVGAIVGSIFGVKALQEKSDFDNGEKTTDKADSVEKNALIADMALGAAITLGVTGTVLLLTNSSSSDKAQTPTHKAFELAPVLSPQRAGAAVTLRF